MVVLMCGPISFLAAQAQDIEPDAGVTEATEESTDGDSRTLSTVTVTAQRQAESAQATPLSIAAVEGDAIQDRGIATVQEFALQIPAVTFKSDFGTTNPNIYIRGVGSTDFNANVTPAVGVYIDEVIQASPSGQLLQFFDTERIEVLRGPQGTLYGRNTTAGAVNIVTRKPTDTFEGYVFGQYGTFNEVKLEGAVSGPITETLSGRISAITHDREGYLRNTTPDQLSVAPRNLNDINTLAVRGQLLWEPTDTSEFLWSISAADSDTTAGQFQHRGLLDPVTGDACPNSLLDRGICVDFNGYADDDGDIYAGQYNDTSIEQVQTFGTSLRATFDLGDYTLKSITGYGENNRLTIFDADESPTPSPATLLPTHDAESWQATQEITLASPVSQPFRWIVGGFYFKEELEFDGEFEFVVPPIGVDLSPRYGYDQEVESYALFGQSYLDVTDALTITAGLRYSQEDRSFDYRAGLELDDGSILPLVAINADTPADDPFLTDTIDFSDWSWRLAADWQVTDDALLYASYSRGSKSGGFNGAFITTDFQGVPFDDETLTAYEVGLKSEWFNNRLRANASAFFYEYDNLQTYILAGPPGSTTPEQSPINANAEVTGGEIEFTARPIDPLLLTLGISYLDGEVTDTPGTGLVTSFGDLSGNPLPLTPELSFNGVATYEVPVESGAYSFSVDYSYQDETFSDVTATDRLKTDDVFLVGARVAYVNEENDYELALWARNLFEEEYVTFVANLQVFGYDRVRYGDPRTFGISLRKNF